MMKRKLIILTEIESDKLLNMMRLLMIAALFLLTQQVKAQQADAKMNSFITSLMNRMTLEEKLGQLNLPSSGDITTGQASSSDIAKKDQ